MTRAEPWDGEEAFAELAAALARRAPRPLEIPLPELRESAVVAPLRMHDGQPELLFTRRADTLRHHAGQISFPGGARDPDDGTALYTALRELEEELGVARDQVTVLGPLDEIPTPSGFRIAPFVGRLADACRVTPDTAEVEELITVPLEAFFAPGQPRIEQRHAFGRDWDIYFYDVGPNVIWGATAHILHSLLVELTHLRSWKRWTQP